MRLSRSSKQDLAGHRLRDPDGHRLEQRLLVAQRDLQLLFEDLAVGEVLQNDQRVAVTRPRGYGADAALRPDQPAIAMHEPALGRVRLLHAALHLVARAPVRGDVVRMHDAFGILADQLLDRITHGLACRVIGADDAETAVEQQRRDRALVEQRAEAFGALGQRLFGLLPGADVARQQQDELAARLLHALDHRLHRELGAVARAIARLSLMRPARPQLVVHGLETFVREPHVDGRERQSLDVVTLVAERLQRRLVGIEQVSVAVDFHHHLADGLERLAQRGERTLGEALAIDAFEQDEHAAEPVARFVHGGALHAQPRTIAERVAILGFARGRLRARVHPLQLLGERGHLRQARRVGQAQADHIGRRNAEQAFEVIVPDAIAQGAVEHADADGRGGEQRPDEQVACRWRDLAIPRRRRRWLGPRFGGTAGAAHQRQQGFIGHDLDAQCLGAAGASGGSKRVGLGRKL